MVPVAAGSNPVIHPKTVRVAAVRRWMVPVLVTSVLAVSGCVKSAAEQYQEREKFLDKATADGITYRGQLQKQGSKVSDPACRIGYDLRDYGPDEIPPAPQDQGFSQKQYNTWLAQIEEAYVKGCLTGRPRPKPEPSGVNAVTPVPIGSGPSGP